MRFLHALAKTDYTRIGFGLFFALAMLVHADGFAIKMPVNESSVPFGDACNLLEITGDEGTTYDAAYSPTDANLIFTLSDKPELRIWNTQTRALTHRFNLVKNDIPIVQWHPLTYPSIQLSWAS